MISKLDLPEYSTKFPKIKLFLSKMWSEKVLLWCRF